MAIGGICVRSPFLVPFQLVRANPFEKCSLHVRARSLDRHSAQIVGPVLVVIDNFNIRRPRLAFRPFKAYPPLVVDADAVFAFAVALQRLEPIPGQNRKVPDCERRFEPVQLHASGAFDTGESFHAFSGGEVGSPLVPEAHDHGLSIAGITLYVKHNVFGRVPRALVQFAPSALIWSGISSGTRAGQRGSLSLLFSYSA